jgi:hypothetical protein
LPPQGLQGEQDLLSASRRIAQPPWDSDQFSPSSDGDAWRLGVGSESGGDTIFITLPPDILELFFGNNAATRISRVEATLTLTTFNPPLVIDKEVYFGLLLQSVDDPANAAGLKIELAQPGVINLIQQDGAETHTISQRSVGAVVARVRLERTEGGQIVILFNDEQMGQPVQLDGTGVIPVLFVKDGGVIVSVTDWSITLR